METRVTSKDTHRDASALHWRLERGTVSFRSGAGFSKLSHPRVMYILFSASSLHEMKFVQKLLSLVYVLFLGGGGGF